MNVGDVEKDQVAEMAEGDMLEAIFQRQYGLRAKYEVIEAQKKLLRPLAEEEIGNLDLAITQAHIKDFAWRIVEELGEAMNCFKNKPWKQSELPTDREHFLEEISDAFHFFIELCQLAGLDAQGLFDIYARKSEVNKFRQRSQY